MNLKKLFPLLALAIFFVSCGGGDNSKKAFEYSELITGKERALTPMIEETEKNVARLFNEGKNDSAKLVADNMANTVQKTIDEINAEPIPAGVKGGEEFKTASLKYFENIKAVYTGYSSLANFSEEDAGFKEESEKLANTVNTNAQSVQDIVAAQMKFAQENGFNVGALPGE